MPSFRLRPQTLPPRECSSCWGPKMTMRSICLMTFSQRWMKSVFGTERIQSGGKVPGTVSLTTTWHPYTDPSCHYSDWLSGAEIPMIPLLLMKNVSMCGKCAFPLQQVVGTHSCNCKGNYFLLISSPLCKKLAHTKCWCCSKSRWPTSLSPIGLSWLALNLLLQVAEVRGGCWGWRRAVEQTVCGNAVITQPVWAAELHLQRLCAAGHEG